MKPSRGVGVAAVVATAVLLTATCAEPSSGSFGSAVTAEHVPPVPLEGTPLPPAEPSLSEQPRVPWWERGAPGALAFALTGLSGALQNNADDIDDVAGFGSLSVGDLADAAAILCPATVEVWSDTRVLLSDLAELRDLDGLTTFDSGLILSFAGGADVLAGDVASHCPDRELAGRSRMLGAYIGGIAGDIMDHASEARAGADDARDIAERATDTAERAKDINRAISTSAAR